MIRKYKLGFYNPIFLPLKIILEIAALALVWFEYYFYAIACFVIYLLLPFLLSVLKNLPKNTLLYHITRGFYIWNNETPRPIIIIVIRYSVIFLTIVMLLHLVSKNITYTFYVIAILYAFRFFTLTVFYKISKNTKGYNDWIIFLNNEI